MEFYWIGNKGIRIEEDKRVDLGDKKMNNRILKLLERKGINYTEQQKEAMFHNEGPALVLSVPGSGKTVTLLGRVANLILNYNVSPINILAITFSRASAIDMNNRFKRLFGDEIKQEIRFSTIHAFANMVVGSYNRKFNKNLVLLKPWQTSYIIQEIYREIFKEEAIEEELDSYITGISYIKNKMLTDDEIDKYEKDSELKKIGLILKRYDSIKKEKNYYDYDDMLELCLQILKENQITLEFLREKYKYVLLDEGQDTSKLQFEIIKLLVSPKNNIFIVADDDQTIYGFRGACPELLLNINNIFNNTKIYFMEQNFRSTKSIIEVANKIIVNNKDRYDKTIFTKKTDNCKSVEVIYLDNISKQNEYIINKIKESNKEVALLYRNNISAIPIANALYNNEIEFHINNYKASFFNHWVVKDIMQIINLISNKSDVEALSNVYYKIKSYLNKNMINQLLNTDIKDNDIFDYLLNNFNLKEHEYDRILTLKVCFEEARKKKVSKGVRDILYQVDYFKYIEKMKDKATSYNEVIDTVIDILDNVEEYSNANERIMKLKERIESSSDNKNTRIFLSTLHGSKGLEFEEVYLLSVLDGVIPSIKKENKYSNNEKIQDDRRLFYVGVTRAKENLKILVPGQETSIFVDELIKEDIDKKYLTIRAKTTKTITYEMVKKKAINNKANIYSNKIIDKNDNLVLQHNFKVGDTVIHKAVDGSKNRVAKGIIKEIDGDKIKIDLEFYGIKVYSLKVLLRNKLISKVTD